MARRTSDLYDVILPSPISLKELSAIAFTIEIWRREVNKYRASNTLKDLDECKKHSSFDTMLPDLPTEINVMIRKYFTRFWHSMNNWLEENHVRVFHLFYNHRNDILEDFDDFIGDYDGTVDYVRTARHMMQCDRFGMDKKFVIACTYFFEDDIRRIWPSVCEKIDLTKIWFSRCPKLYYWVYRLKDRLQEFPILSWYTVDMFMLEECIRMSYNRLAVEYFWKRGHYENQTEKAIMFHHMRKEHFVRFILPKLDDTQLDEFVNKYGYGDTLMENLLNDEFCDERLIFQTWNYIRNVMDENTFTNLVVIMLRSEAGYVEEMVPKSTNWFHFCCEIWNTAPNNLKTSTIKNIAHDSELIICSERNNWNTSSKFLLFFLSHATAEERRSFWSNCWQNLTLGTHVYDLRKIMETCLENEDEMIQFKETSLASGIALRHCSSLLEQTDFYRLNHLVNFYCPSAETARHLKQQLLQSLVDDSVFQRQHILCCEELNKLINDAYDSADTAADFKSQLVLADVNLSVMYYALSISLSFQPFMKFINIFVSTEETMKQIKTSFIDYLESDAVHHPPSVAYFYSRPCFDEFLMWCLGSDEEVIKFKRIHITPCLR